MNRMPKTAPEPPIRYYAANKKRGRMMAYSVSEARALGSVGAAILLHHVLWLTTESSQHVDGKIQRTKAELAEETGLGIYEIDSARKLLIAKSILVAEEKRLIHTTLYSIDESQYDQFFNESYGTEPWKKSNHGHFPNEEKPRSGERKNLVRERGFSSFDTIYETKEETKEETSSLREESKEPLSSLREDPHSLREESKEPLSSLRECKGDAEKKRIRKISASTQGNGKKPKPPSEDPMKERPLWFDEALWREWIEHRKEIRKPMTERAARMLAKELERWIGKGATERDCMESVENSIAHGYQGVFEPKTQQRGKAGDEYDYATIKRNARMAADKFHVWAEEQRAKDARLGGGDD